MDVRALFIEGLNLGREREHERALDCFDRVLQADPAQSLARYNRGVCLLRLGRYNESAAAFKQLLSERPGDADIFNNLGKILSGSGNHEQARTIFEKTLSMAPDHADALCRLGIIYGRNFGDVDRASDLFRKALALNEKLAPAHLGLAICHHHNADYEAAAHHLRRAIELNPQSAAAHNHLGIACMKLGDEQNADKHFKQALRIDPNAKLRHENLWQFQDEYQPPPAYRDGMLSGNSIFDCALRYLSRNFTATPRAHCSSSLSRSCAFSGNS